jgi:tetratricopeptide (TPR) repeat protein
MPSEPHVFISYSSVDGIDFALQLADELISGSPAIRVWIDKRDLRPGEAWDEQLVEAIRTCKGILFIMTRDSVDPRSGCTNEWARALKYKKPIIPLQLHPEADLPYRLEPREYINFAINHVLAVAKLRKHLLWMDSPEGQLQTLKLRLADAKRDLPRTAEADKQARIEEEISILEKQIAQQQEILDNPKGAQERVQQSIQQGLERIREPEKPVQVVINSKFINQPPLTPPTWFQDRHAETAFLGEFLKDEALRLVTIVGRGGVGKTALTCRLLRSLQKGQLPDDGGELKVDGIVYLSNARAFHRVTYPDIFSSLLKLLSEDHRASLETLYKDPLVNTSETMLALLEGFPQGRVVVLLDNFEDEVDIESGQIKNADLVDALRALLEAPPHSVKVIITTRIAPVDIASVHPELQRRRDLDAGLPTPYAEEALRKMDADGRIGLRDAPELLLKEAQRRTQGYPRALEHLYGILSADRSTPLEEILDNTREVLPERVMTVLVGEAFSRLDATAQMVMQALGVYRYPVQPAAVDYLLQSYIAGIDSAGVLSRLTNMQFVRRDAGRFYLHQIDREYALSRISQGTPEDRNAIQPPFSRFALLHRAAEWFLLARKPQANWKTLEDLSAHLSEFALRCDGEDYNTAASLLFQFDFEYLMRWGHYHLSTELHERLLGKITDQRLMQGSLGNLGNAYFYLGQHNKAEQFFMQALNAARVRKDRAGECRLLNNVGNCYRETGQLTKALECFQQALITAHEVGDQQGEGGALGNLGIVYASVGKFALAIEHYEKALAIDGEMGDRDSGAIDMHNLGDVYCRLGQYTLALDCFQKGMQLAHESGNRVSEIMMQNNIGIVHLLQGEYNTAITIFEKVIVAIDDISFLQGQTESRFYLACTYMLQEKLSAANEMIRAAAQFKFPLNLPDVFVVLGIVALRQGDCDTGQRSFTTSLQHIRAMNDKSHPLYQDIFTTGLALCGLAICENAAYVSIAKTTFGEARAICAEKGVIQWITQLFDALAKADSNGLLREVRPCITGE